MKTKVGATYIIKSKHRIEFTHIMEKVKNLSGIETSTSTTHHAHHAAYTSSAVSTNMIDLSATSAAELLQLLVRDTIDTVSDRSCIYRS